MFVVRSGEWSTTEEAGRPPGSSKSARGRSVGLTRWSLTPPPTEKLSELPRDATGSKTTSGQPASTDGDVWERHTLIAGS